MHTTADAQSYTSPHRLDVAARLIDLSLQHGARTIPEQSVADAIRSYNADQANQDRQLNAGQIAMVTGFAGSPFRIESANAPAGSGKTTAMRVLVDAWRASGGTVLGLAPTASAAAVLAEATGARGETADKLLTVLDNHTPNTRTTTEDMVPSLPQWVLQIDTDTVVIIDEHVRLGDDKRLRLFEFLATRGATIRCVGDDKQLPSIEAGGTAADTADAQRASTLTHVVRFADPTEATASLHLREGDPAGLGYYLDHQRIHAGAHAAVHDDAYTRWTADHVSGRDTIMLARSHDIVRELNEHARSDRLARNNDPVGPETQLADGHWASAGDTICTRRNDARLRVGDRDWVRNGYRWLIDAVHPDGSITATHLRPGRQLGHTTVLPATYVGTHVRLGYATTIDSAQGITVDTCHTVLTRQGTRKEDPHSRRAHRKAEKRTQTRRYTTMTTESRRSRRSEPINSHTAGNGAKSYWFRVDVGAKPDGARDRQRFTYSTLKEARREYRRITTEVAERRYVPRTTITVGEYLQNWLDGRRDVRRVTLEGYRNALKPVIRRLGELPLQKLTKQHLDDLVTWRLTEGRSGHRPMGETATAILEFARSHPDGVRSSEVVEVFGANGSQYLTRLHRSRHLTRVRRGLYKAAAHTPLPPAPEGVSEQTVTTMLVQLSSALEDAAEQGLLPRNIARSVRRPTARTKDLTVWTRDQSRQFREHVRPHRLYALFLLSLCGLRRSEIMGLEWSAVDFETGTVEVRQGRVTVTSTETEIGDPKSWRSKRMLPIPPDVLQALRTFHTAQATEKLAIGRGYPDDHDLVARHEDGTPIRPEWYGDEAKRQMTRCRRTGDQAEGHPPHCSHDPAGLRRPTRLGRKVARPRPCSTPTRLRPSLQGTPGPGRQRVVQRRHHGMTTARWPLLGHLIDPIKPRATR